MTATTETSITQPGVGHQDYLSVLQKSRHTFNARQMLAFRGLHAWREAISCELNMSEAQILPNNLMIRIAEFLPREPQGITALCNPIPLIIKKYLKDIHSIIIKALDKQIDESLSNLLLLGNNHLTTIDPSLRSIDLDLMGNQDKFALSEDIPCLLDVKESHSEKKFKESRDIHTSVLYRFLDTEADHQNQQKEALNNDFKFKLGTQSDFISPYQRYVESRK